MNYPISYAADFGQRDPAPGVDALFVERWSPRAMRKVEIPQADLRTIFDAARWSPSCYNEQPWRFVTSTPASFATFLDLLVEANQGWARNASVLGFVFADKKFARNGSDNALAVFDSGAAWMALTLGAHAGPLHPRHGGHRLGAGACRARDGPGAIRAVRRLCHRRTGYARDAAGTCARHGAAVAAAAASGDLAPGGLSAPRMGWRVRGASAGPRRRPRNSRAGGRIRQIRVCGRADARRCCRRVLPA